MVDIDSQQKKILSYLNPDNVKLDNRNLIDHIAFTVNFAKLITFYNEENKPDGNWQKVLLKDPVFVLAYIAKMPYKQFEIEFITSENDLNKIFVNLVSITNLINSWVKCLNVTTEKYPFRDFVLDTLENHIGLILYKLQVLNTNLKKLPNNHEIIKYNIQQYDLIYKEYNGSQLADITNLSIPDQKQKVKDLYKEIIFFVKQVNVLAKNQFEVRFKEKNNFSDMSLLLAIMHLMQYAQSDLNQFTKKHLDFYYKRILQQRKKIAEPDYAFILVEPSKEVDGVTLPQGFAFLAGIYADNSPIHFATQETTSVNHIKIGQIINSFANKKHYLTYFNNNKSHVDESGKQITNKWFGKSTDKIPTQQGFMLASPMFTLASGKRVVTLILELDKACTLNIEKLQLSTEKKWITIPKTDLEQEIIQNGYLYDRKNTLHGIKHSITIILSKSFMPIATLVKGATEDKENQKNPLNYPCCKITLAQDPTESPPRLLALQIEVNVENSDAVTLSNDFGVLLNKPISIFGPTPKKDDTFYLNCHEALSKPLSKKFIINFDWTSDLPKSLKKYYTAYNEYVVETNTNSQSSKIQTQTHSNFSEPKPSFDIINNLSFKIMVEPHYAKNESVNPESFYADFQLFNQKSIKKITAQNNINTEETDNKLTSQYQLSSENIKKLIGATRLNMTLSAPNMGFGNSIYAQVVSYITLQNSIKKPNKHKELPNVPYVPKVKNITVDYHAVQNINFCSNQDKLTQDFALIHFGVFTPYCYYYQTHHSDKAMIDLSKTVVVPKQTNVEIDKNAAKQVSLPQQGLSLFQGVHNHCVYINLTDVIVSSELSIFIAISATILQQKTPIEFFYWSNQGWKTLSLLSDQTYNLTVSGIITVFLPKDIAIDPVQFSHKENTCQNAWLLLRQTNNIREINVICCETQAIKVQRQTPIKLPLGVKPLLKAGSINAPEIKNKCIARITQPFDSFGGVASECEDDFQKRVSQHIKTKNRASSHWDYVTLAKQACQDLFFAGILKQEHEHNQVCLGVVKQYQSVKQSGALRPAFSNRDLLTIKEYIDKRKSDAVSFSVKNIPYQTVKVIVDLKKSQHSFESSITPLLNDIITLYLSPWITSKQLQYKIFQGVKKSELVGLISKIEGIDYVMDVKILLEETDNENQAMEFQETFFPEKNHLLVSSLGHDFQFHDRF